MSCPHSPHGDPKKCSQCIGAVPRKIVHDEKTGMLTIDGKAVRRFQPATVAYTTHVKRGRGMRID